MKQIKLSDVTMKQSAEGFSLSFKEKIELSKLLDKLGVDIIEFESIKNARTDTLLIKSVASVVEHSTLSVCVELNEESVRTTWEALKFAKKPRLLVSAPVSSVQMEYLSHKKPEAMLKAIEETVSLCCSLCEDTEFVAEDATRSEQEFLTKALFTAIKAGAKTVTLSDTAGVMLPFEFAAFVEKQYKELPTLNDVCLGVSCADTLAMADASLIAAVASKAGQVKTAAFPISNASLLNVARLLDSKKDTLSAFCGVKVNQLSRAVDQIAWMCQATKGVSATLGGEDAQQDNIALTVRDDISAISGAVEKLGYDLSDEDITKVFAAFKDIAEKKEKVGLKELDAIVASSAMQVPSTYKLDTYVVTSGNNASATAHIKLTKNGELLEGVYMGDGAIDAAFQAIEKITGYHFELDDFQLQAVTEGREAMGQTVVKLRSNGKVYSGRGISTDIVGAGIYAYLSALNKIIYEEAE